MPLSFAFAADPQITGGLISETGVTFATESAMKEGIDRGDHDDRNSFVGNVGCIIFSVEEGFHTATITRIAPDTYLMCKHTLLEIQKSCQVKGPQMQLALKFGKVVFSRSAEIIAIAHLEQDFAVVKMTFEQIEGEYPRNLPFLPILPTPITEDKFSAFSVSCAEPFYATSGAAVGVISSDETSISAKIHRVLSVHTIETASFSSFIRGRLPDALTKEMIEAVKARNPEAIKVASGKGTFFLGEDHRLASACSFGASGSPLVAKTRGDFFLTGILSTGTTSLRRLGEPHTDVASNASQLQQLEHHNKFLNLTPHANWIEDACLSFVTPVQEPTTCPREAGTQVFSRTTKYKSKVN